MPVGRPMESCLISDFSCILVLSEVLRLSVSGQLKARHGSTKNILLFQFFLFFVVGLLVSSLLKNVANLNFAIFTTRCHGNPRWLPNKRRYSQFVSKALYAYLIGLLKWIQIHIMFILTEGF